MEKERNSMIDFSFFLIFKWCNQSYLWLFHYTWHNIQQDELGKFCSPAS